MTGDDAGLPKNGKPRLRVIEGERAKFERTIFNLIISPYRADHEDEFERMLKILKRRGNLTSVPVGQNSSPVIGEAGLEEDK